MKKTFNFKSSIRWFILFALLFSLAGCTTLANFFGFDYNEETGGCDFAPLPFGGCGGPAEDLGQFGPYDLLRGPRPHSGIYPRDMGFQKDSDHYIPINKESSSN